MEDVGEFVFDGVQQALEPLLVGGVEVVAVEQRDLVGAFGLAQGQVALFVVLGAAHQHDVLGRGLLDESYPGGLFVGGEPYVVDHLHHGFDQVAVHGHELRRGRDLIGAPSVLHVDVVGRHIVVVQPFVQFGLPVVAAQTEDGVVYMECVFLLAGDAADAEQKQQREKISVEFHVS